MVIDIINSIFEIIIKIIMWIVIKLNLYATLILVIITAFYAFSTQNMVKVMNKEYKLNTTPFLVINRDVDRVMDTKIHNKIIQLKFKFDNFGKVPIKYYTERVELNGQDITPEKVNVFLYPNQQGTLHTKPYKSETAIGEGDGLEGSIQIVYWAEGIPEQKTSFLRKFRLAARINTFIIEEKIIK